MNKLIYFLLLILLVKCQNEDDIPDIENDDYYKLLQIEKNADIKAIKQAYRRLAVRWHPDKNPDNQEQATIIFRGLTEAYDCLSNQECRDNYDKFGKEGLKNQQRGQNNGGGWNFNFDFGDIFSNFGGFKNNNKQKFHGGSHFTFERAEEIFKRVFEDDDLTNFNNHNDNKNNFNNDNDNIFGNSGFKFKTNFGSNNGFQQTFSSSQTFTTSSGGRNGGSQTISTSTIIKNGKRVEVKKVSITRPDGTVDTKVTETVIDNQGKRLTSEYNEQKEQLDYDL